MAHFSMGKYQGEEYPPGRGKGRAVRGKSTPSTVQEVGITPFPHIDDIGEQLQNLLNIPSTGRKLKILDQNNTIDEPQHVKLQSIPGQSTSMASARVLNQSSDRQEDPVIKPRDTTMKYVSGNMARRYANLEPCFKKKEMPEEICDAQFLIEKAIRLEDSYLLLDTSELKILASVREIFSYYAITRLLKKVSKFPRALYWCSTCNYHLDSLFNVVQHVSSERHAKAYEVAQFHLTIDNLNELSWDHQIAISKVILATVTTYGITRQDQMIRCDLVKRVRKAFSDRKLEYVLHVFGSSLSGFGFLDSDVNLNVDVPTTKPYGQDLLANIKALTTILELLKSLDFCKKVSEKRASKWLTLTFEDEPSGKVCTIHLNNGVGVAAGVLFSEYDKLDDRIRAIVNMFRFWARKTDIQSPGNGTLPGLSYTIMAIHYLQEIKVIPILHHPKPILNEKGQNLAFDTAEEALEKWDKKGNETLGYLFVGLLRYYAKFAAKDKVVSMSQPAPSRKSDKAWNRKLSIEDPILPRTNLSRSLSNNKVCDYIFERIKVAYLYFAIPRHKGGPLFDGVIQARNVRPRNNMYYFNKVVHHPNDTLQDVIRQMQNSSLQPQPCHQSSPTEVIVSNEKSKARARLVNIMGSNGMTKVFVVQEDIQLLSDVLTQDEYFYEFNETILLGNEKPPRFCKACSADGHLKMDCPEETLPKMKRIVADPTPFTLKVLSGVMHRNYELESLNESDVRIRKKITEEIYSALTHAFSDIDLTMFGSTYNGFGLHMSDVDICLRLKRIQLSKADLQSEEVNGILRTVVAQLKASGCMQEILAIPSAKVPIVKFRHRMSKLEGDISLSNVLALHNTKMLRLYTEIDDRLKVLGCFLKRLTKLCDISDASKGSLSSYGYVLMIIHFLQQHNPPVLPVLQELPPGQKPTRLVEGCDAYFYSDIRNLAAVWPQYGKNKQSVSELWTALIKYYVEEFQFDEQVISINQLAPLTRFSKLWLSETVIAIEDPFERSHNLGAGLSRRMGVHIVKTFQRFREIFTIPIDNIGDFDWLSWFLDPRRIRGNINPPVDRQCRICNRIGHFARNCTFSVTNDDRSYSYKDEEAPSHQNRNKITGNVGSRQVPTKTLYPTRVIQNKKKASEEASHTALIDRPKAKQPSKQNVNSFPTQKSSSVGGQEKRLARTGTVFTKDKRQEASHPSSEISVNSNTDVLPHQPSQQFHVYPGSPEIQFFGFGNQDSDRAIEAMISRNPGVVFQLRDHEETETQKKASRNGLSSPSPAFLSIGPITPPQEYRSNSTQSQTPKTLSPPPGFIKQIRPQIEEVDPRVEQGLTFFGSAVPYTAPIGIQVRPFPPFGVGSSSTGETDIAGYCEPPPVPIPPFPIGGPSTGGTSITGHCAPPPGFNSLPITTQNSYSVHPPLLGISNNFQVAGNMYQQLTTPMNLSLPFSQDVVLPGMPPGIPVSVIENNLNTSASMSHISSNVLNNEQQHVSVGMPNGLLPIQNFPTYYTHGHAQAQQVQLNNIQQLNGLLPSESSLFHSIGISTPSTIPNTKSSVMIMRGDLISPSSNDIMGASSHSYLLSHVHHGPVVSAVPGQTGHHPHMVPIQPQYPYRYAYPFQYPHMPIQYHHQMIHPGYGQYAHLEDATVISDGSLRMQGTASSTYLNSFENIDN